MPAITPLSTPVPTTSDPTNFDARADTLVGELPTLVDEINATVLALPFGAAKWVSGTTYAEGDLVWSPTNYHTYRRAVAGAGATDPISDTTNWAALTAAPTRQVFLTGTAATYTTPVGARQLRIRMKGGGGGSNGSGSTEPAGSAGGDTIFNSINAAGGAVGTQAAGGVGGTGGTGIASVRIAGATGQKWLVIIVSGTNAAAYGGAGGGQGGNPSAPTAGNGAANSGGGASGGGLSSQTFATFATTVGSSGGGEGEYAELIINNPAATYTYTVGAGGSAGTAGAGGVAGGTGGSGYIIVDEYY